MNADMTGNRLMFEEKTDWKQFRRLTDEDIRTALEADADIDLTDERFWQGAKVVMPRRKAILTICLDINLLEWLRQEKGYQTRINAVLRTYWPLKSLNLPELTVQTMACGTMIRRAMNGNAERNLQNDNACLRKTRLD